MLDRLTVVLLVLFFGGFSLVAGEPGADAPVPLYTNADLERLSPLPPPPDEPVARPGLGGWDDVVAFLERENAKISARNRDDAQRSQARDAYVQYDSGRRGFFPFAGQFLNGVHGANDRRSGPRGVFRYERHGIRPIHAGPSNVERMRARVILRNAN